MGMASSDYQLSGGRPPHGVVDRLDLDHDRGLGRQLGVHPVHPLAHLVELWTGLVDLGRSLDLVGLLGLGVVTKHGYSRVL